MRVTIPCISLWQPWASLVACGAKPIETRSWPAPRTIVGRRIAIHAAKTEKGLRLVEADTILHEACGTIFSGMTLGELPRGVIVATTIVDSSWRTEVLGGDIFGDFTPGRFGWKLRDTLKLETPIPWSGAQGIFNVQLDMQTGYHQSVYDSEASGDRE